MANLMEAYKQRLQVSEAVYGREHGGAKMDNHRKLTVAKCLENANRFLNEAFDNSTGTQRSDMGLWKKFCLNLTTVALPNLIANELVIVSPMSSMSGYLTYVQYTKGTTKGASTQGDVLNDPFRLGKVDSTYTSNVVAETKKGDGTTKEFNVAWTPVIVDEKRTQVKVNGVAQVIGTDVTFDAAGKFTFTTAPANNAEISIGYLYDNIVIPQNDIPMLNAHMESIPLIAKARRISIYYSNIAAYQAGQ